VQVVLPRTQFNLSYLMRLLIQCHTCD